MSYSAESVHFLVQAKYLHCPLHDSSGYEVQFSHRYLPFLLYFWPSGVTVSYNLHSYLINHCCHSPYWCFRRDCVSLAATKDKVCWLYLFSCLRSLFNSFSLALVRCLGLSTVLVIGRLPLRSHKHPCLHQPCSGYRCVMKHQWGEIGIYFCLFCFR